MSKNAIETLWVVLTGIEYKVTLHVSPQLHSQFMRFAVMPVHPGNSVNDPMLNDLTIVISVDNLAELLFEYAVSE